MFIVFVAAFVHAVWTKDNNAMYMVLALWLGIFTSDLHDMVVEVHRYYKRENDRWKGASNA